MTAGKEGVEASYIAQLVEQGAWADGCSVLTCGASTGHFVRPIAFCDKPETAIALAAALSLVDERKLLDRAQNARGEA